MLYRLLSIFHVLKQIFKHIWWFLTILGGFFSSFWIWSKKKGWKIFFSLQLFEILKKWIKQFWSLIKWTFHGTEVYSTKSAEIHIFSIFHLLIAYFTFLKHIWPFFKHILSVSCNAISTLLDFLTAFQFQCCLQICVQST